MKPWPVTVEDFEGFLEMLRAEMRDRAAWAWAAGMLDACNGEGSARVIFGQGGAAFVDVEPDGDAGVTRALSDFEVMS